LDALAGALVFDVVPMVTAALMGLTQAFRTLIAQPGQPLLSDFDCSVVVGGALLATGETFDVQDFGQRLLLVFAGVEFYDRMIKVSFVRHCPVLLTPQAASGITRNGGCGGLVACG
jgi:hypothetical protein